MTRIDDLWLHRLVREIDKYTDNSSAMTDAVMRDGQKIQVHFLGEVLSQLRLGR